jgi:hypothetical protein
MTQPPPYGEQPAYGPPPGYGPPGYGPPPGYGQPGYGPPPGYGQPPGYPVYGPPPNEGNAIAALILSISSFVICPLLPAVIALILAGVAKRNIIASGGTKAGLGLVTAARVISWVNIGLVTAFLVIVAIGLVAASHSSVSTTP